MLCVAKVNVSLFTKISSLSFFFLNYLLFKISKKKCKIFRCNSDVMNWRSKVADLCYLVFYQFYILIQYVHCINILLLYHLMSGQVLIPLSLKAASFSHLTLLSLNVSIFNCLNLKISTSNEF